MTIIAETPAIATVEEWCAEVRRLHDEHATPISSMDDPRVAEYATSVRTSAQYPDMSIRHFKEEITENPEHAGEMYFKECVKLPAAPISGPTWARSHDTSVWWPEVQFDFQSADVNIGDVTARAKHMVAVDVTDPSQVRSLTENTADVELIVDGHPVDFCGASVATLKCVAAALLSVVTSIGEGLSK